jgi:uncharacterized protein
MPAARSTMTGWLVVLAMVGAVSATAPGELPARLLVLSHSAAFQHDVVRREAPDRLSLAEQTIADLARRAGVEVAYAYTRDDVERLTPSSLQRFDGFLLFTTGAVPMTPDARGMLLDLVKSGRGLIGVHSATDTWYDSEDYAACIGGRFDGHPWNQRVRIRIEDTADPSAAHLGAAFEITDEIYQFSAWDRRRAHVLLSLDPGSVDVRKGKRADADYALAWRRECGKGRVFYTALGHRPEVWTDERFRVHLLGGIRWALGRA